MTINQTCATGLIHWDRISGLRSYSLSKVNVTHSGSSLGACSIAADRPSTACAKQDHYLKILTVEFVHQSLSSTTRITG